MTDHHAGAGLVAFVDESKKPARDPLTGRVLPQSWYAMAAVIVLAAQADEIRNQLVAISRDFRPRLHYKELSPSARRDALSRVAELPDWDAVVVETERPVQIRDETTVRRAVLAALLHLVATEHGVTAVVVESRSRSGYADTLDLADRTLLTEMTRLGALPHGIKLTHARKDEPLLSLPDLIVSARSDALSRLDWRAWTEVSGRVGTVQVHPRWRR